MFNTRVNVYFQGNRKCSFLPGCACLYFIDLLISLVLKINDDDDDDDESAGGGLALNRLALARNGCGLQV